MIKSLIFVIIITGILAGLSFAVQPQPGDWKLTGTGKWSTNQDGKIFATFVVTDDRNLIKIYTHGVLIYEGNSYPNSVIYKFPHLVKGSILIYSYIELKITDGNFSLEDIFVYIKGTFDSKTAAHGTW